jgi:hypothetical protein
MFTTQSSIRRHIDLLERLLDEYQLELAEHSALEDLIYGLEDLQTAHQLLDKLDVPSESPNMGEMSITERISYLHGRLTNVIRELESTKQTYQTYRQLVFGEVKPDHSVREVPQPAKTRPIVRVVFFFPDEILIYRQGPCGAQSHSYFPGQSSFDRVARVLKTDYHYDNRFGYVPNC